MQLSLHVHFRNQGLKWPLRDEDDVQVWTLGHVLMATLSGRLIRQLVELHLAGAAVQAEVGVALRRRPLVSLPARRPGADAANRLALRERRRSR
jgi:hypothetical protein